MRTSEMKAKLQALFLPTHILVPSCRRPNLRDRCLQKASRTRSGADGRDLCFLVVDAKGPPLAGSPYDRDLPYVTHGNALPRRTLRRPGPSWRSTRSPRSTRGGRRAGDESTCSPRSTPQTNTRRRLNYYSPALLRVYREREQSRRPRDPQLVEVPVQHLRVREVVHLMHHALADLS